MMEKNIDDASLKVFLERHFRPFLSDDEKMELLEMGIDEAKEDFIESGGETLFDEEEDDGTGRCRPTGNKIDYSPVSISPYWIWMYARLKAKREIEAMSPDEFRKQCAALMYRRKSMARKQQ